MGGSDKTQPLAARIQSPRSVSMSPYDVNDLKHKGGRRNNKGDDC